MSATRDKKKEEKGKGGTSLAKLLGDEKTAGGHQEHVSGGRSLVGSIGAGLGKLFGNLLPAVFKSTKIKETATQVFSTPLGGKFVGTYTTEVEVEGAPEVIQAIEEAKEETERAQIEADKEVKPARIGNDGKEEES